MRLALRRVLRDSRQRLNHVFTAAGIILLYHRIADTVPDPYTLAVSPEHFEEQLWVMRRVGSPVALNELADRLRTGAPLRRAICITFDDAYQDNLYTAKPLLERYEAPATVFATTGVGRSREFWWDELERVLLATHPLPRTIELEINGRSLSWDLGNLADVPAVEWSRHSGWTVRDDHLPSERHAVFSAIYEVLRPLSHAERAAALDQLTAWSGNAPTVRPSHRALEPGELRTLEDGGLIRVGAHTVHHPSLPAHPDAVQRHEISSSRRTLEEWLGHPVESFAYPYGHVSPAAVSAVQQAGFDQACSCLSQPVRRGSDLFTLPRVEIGDWDGHTFERRLRWYFGV